VEQQRWVRLRRWWDSARSTAVESTWERRFWIVVALVGLAWEPLRTSIPVLFFMSAWACQVGAAGRADVARREMLEEQADEAEPD
jgi:hypothetical protein